MWFFHYCLTGVLLKNGIKTFPAFCENAQLAIVRSLGLGCVPNEPGAEIGAGPDQYTACKVLNSHPDMLANLKNLYVQALLAKYQIIQVCIACQVVDMDGNALLAR